MYTKITPNAKKGGDFRMQLSNLSHCTYLCRYHIVWIPRYRKKVLADKYIKLQLKLIFKSICRWKGFRPLGWHIGDEHIHLHLSIPPKYSLSYAICVLKSKSSAWIKKKTKKLPKGSLWARGYFVTTVGITEEIIKKYIEKHKHQQIDWPKLPF